LSGLPGIEDYHSIQVYSLFLFTDENSFYSLSLIVLWRAVIVILLVQRLERSLVNPLKLKPLNTMAMPAASGDLRFISHCLGDTVFFNY
jgi:hypothetical protein